MPEMPYQYSARSSLRHPFLLVLAADAAFGLWSLPHWPERVPIHWDVTRTADRFASPLTAALGLPGLATGRYLYMLFGPRWSLKLRRHAERSAFYRWYAMLAPLVVIGLHLVTSFVTWSRYAG